jgi:signal transduction histidine kinase
MPASASPYSPLRLLVIASAVLVASFVASTLYAQWRASAIDAKAIRIASDAAPSIARLASARTELRHLEVGVDWAIRAAVEKRSIDRVLLTAPRQQLDRDLDALRSLAAASGQQSRQGELQRRTARFYQAVDHALARASAGDLAVARAIDDGEVLPAADDLDAASARIVDEHADEANRLALHIEATRRQAALVAYGLQGLSAALALIVMGLAIRSARQHAGLLVEKNRMCQERADELELFAGRVAHDLRNPLGAIALKLAVARRRFFDDARIAEVSDALLRNVEGMGRLIEGLLEFARAGARPRPGARAEVGPLLQDVLSEVGPAAEQARVDLAVDRLPTVTVACMPATLTSVLANLLQNALKYIDGGTRPLRRIWVRVRERSGAVRFEVEDTGRGLPPGMEAAVFEPFVRVHDERTQGIGLGLATVKRVVEAYGGSVGVESVPGRGSCFWFELPAVAS